jgi:hypothetical protein
MIMILEEGIKADDEDLALVTFECFSFLIEAKSKLLFNNYPQIINLITNEQILFNKNTSNTIKEMCFDLLITISELKRVLLYKNPAVMKQVIEVVIRVVAESECVDDDEEEGVRESALNLLEVLAVNLPKKKTYKVFLSSIL